MAFTDHGRNLLVKRMDEEPPQNDFLISIRVFNYPDDYASVYELWKISGSGIQLRKSDEPEEIQKKIQRDPDLFLVAEVNGEIIGSVLGGFDGRRGMVYHLAVIPAYRNQGVGSALMRMLEKKLREKGCLRTYMLVTKDNQEAIRFYENHGWKQMELYILGKNLE